MRGSAEVGVRRVEVSSRRNASSRGAKEKEGSREAKRWEERESMGSGGRRRSLSSEESFFSAFLSRAGGESLLDRSRFVDVGLWLAD